MEEKGKLKDSREPRRSPFDYYERLSRLRTHVSNNLEKELSRDEAASIARMEPAAFSRFFRREVGMTYSTWRTYARLERATELIETRNLPLARIARLTGFQSPRTFRRAFKDRLGVCPQQYRSRHRARMTETVQADLLPRALGEESSAA